MANKKEKMEITEEGAMDLLGAMLQYSAEDFEGGVRDYLESMKAEQKAKTKLKAALKALNEAHEMRAKALRAITQEKKFLSGEEIIPPMVNGELVMSKIIMGILSNFDYELYMAMLKQGERND